MLKTDFIYCLEMPQTLCSSIPSYIKILNSEFQEFSSLQVPSSCVTFQNKQFSYEVLPCPIKHQYIHVDIKMGRSFVSPAVDLISRIGRTRDSFKIQMIHKVCPLNTHCDSEPCSVWCLVDRIPDNKYRCIDHFVCRLHFLCFPS